MKSPHSKGVTKPSVSEPEFPMLITVREYPGITSRIYKQVRTKGEAEYTAFIVAYTLLGKRKLESCAKLDDAIAVAKDAIRKISNGEQAVLELHNGDVFTYLRAKEHAAGVALP